MQRLLLLTTFLIAFASCGDNEPTQQRAEDTTPPIATTPVINYKVVAQHPHDPSLFTEGLLVHDGKIFESTGSPDDVPETRSLIGTLDLKTGKLDKKIELDRSKYFGEGIAILRDKLYQLTYKNQMGFVYDAKTFKQKGTFSYTNPEGWGLTTNGSELIMSDGTATLAFLDAENQRPIRTLQVTEYGIPVEHLNELEYINGFVYANIWLTSAIVKINPADGKVMGRLDLASLYYEAKSRNHAVDVPNGIAFDSTTDRIFVTGKLWSNIYQIAFVH